MAKRSRTPQRWLVGATIITSAESVVPSVRPRAAPSRIAPPQSVQQRRIHAVGKGHLESFIQFHRTTYGSISISRPGTSGNAVVHVPVKHGLQTPGRFGRSVEQHAKPTVDDLAPSNAAAVVKTHPGARNASPIAFCTAMSAVNINHRERSPFLDRAIGARYIDGHAPVHRAGAHPMRWPRSLPVLFHDVPRRPHTGCALDCCPGCCLRLVRSIGCCR